MKTLLLLLAITPLHTQVGDVDLTKPCTYLFHKKDVTYLPSGAMRVKKVTIWNTPPNSEGKIEPVPLTGEVPPVPKGIPTADFSQPVRAMVDSRWCKPLKNHRAECKNVVFNPTAIKIGDWRRK